jgi:hypothetical protein
VIKRLKIQVEKIQREHKKKFVEKLKKILKTRILGLLTASLPRQPEKNFRSLTGAKKMRLSLHYFNYSTFNFCFVKATVMLTASLPGQPEKNSGSLMGSLR